MFTRVLGALLVLFIAVICRAQERLPPRPTPRRPASQPVPPRFIIGVFQQPTSSFDAWRVRGVNTLVGYEGESGSKKISNPDWSNAAAAKGLFYIKQPSDDLDADAHDPNLLAWMHNDEPDVKKPPTDPKILQAAYADWKMAAPKLPVFINFSGGNVLGGKVPAETYQEYLKAADWSGNDFYAVTGYNRPDWLWKIGAAVDQLRTWSGGKPQFALIETSAQRLSWTPKTTRGVSANQLRAEIWHAVIHGVKGVIYFPQQIGEGFRYDATPQKVALEMSLQNKRLTELAEVWSSEMNPPVDGAKPQAATPIELGWRVHGKSLYLIALNFSDDTAKAQVLKTGLDATTVKVTWDKRTIDLQRGAITDDFAPYELKIYEIPLSK